MPCAITIASLCILLIPPAAENLGYQAVIALRAIEGAMHGVLFPSVHYLLSKWAPIAERARWGSFVYAGDYLMPNFNDLNFIPFFSLWEHRSYQIMILTM